MNEQKYKSKRKIKDRQNLERRFQRLMDYMIGYGYGSGERPVLMALKQFLNLLGKDPARDIAPYQYNYEVLETELGPALAWLLISQLCERGVFNYGTSPRFAWVDDIELVDFIRDTEIDDLLCLIGETNQLDVDIREWKEED